MTDDSAAALAPVFVDPSGRRARLARAVGLVAAAVCGLYLLLVGVTLVAPPGVLPLSIPGLGALLPGPGAPALSDETGRSVRPAAVISPTPSVVGRSAAPSSTGRTTPRASVTSTPTRSPTARPGATPTATATPTVTPTTTGRPTGAPTTRPTAKPSPTVRRTGKPTAAPTPHGSGRP